MKLLERLLSNSVFGWVGSIIDFFKSAPETIADAKGFMKDIGWKNDQVTAMLDTLGQSAEAGAGLAADSQQKLAATIKKGVIDLGQKLAASRGVTLSPETTLADAGSQNVPDASKDNGTGRTAG